MPILDFISYLISIIDRVIVPFIFALAFLAFIWGVAQAFIFNVENSEKRENGKKYVFAAIIGFFLMISIWGITRVLVNTFRFDAQNRPTIPHF